MTTSSRWEQTLHSATRVTVQYHTCECAPSSYGVRRCQSGECKREGAVTRAQLQFFTRVPLLGVQSNPGARCVPCSGMLVRAHAELTASSSTEARHCVLRLLPEVLQPLQCHFFPAVATFSAVAVWWAGPECRFPLSASGPESGKEDQISLRLREANSR